MCSFSEFGRFTVALLVLIAWIGPVPATAPQGEVYAGPCASLIGAVQNDSERARLAVCSLVFSDLHSPGVAQQREQLKKFYAPSYALAWSGSGQPTAQARSLIELLQNAQDKGLDPEDYDGARWATRLAEVFRRDPAPSNLANFDVELTLSAMRYIADLHLGRVRPADGGISLPAKRLDGAEFLRSRVAASGDVKTAIAQLEPPFAAYRALLKSLQEYNLRARQQQGKDETLLPPVARPVLPGQTYPGAAALAARLGELGELSTDAQLPPQQDFYDGILVTAVRHFQWTHGLPPDGRIAPETIRELNVPLSSRVLQIRLALERWRWLPERLQPPLIVVNVPEFQLRAYADDAPAFATKVIVGKAYDRRTPLFADEMELVVFRPYWNVPLSIVRNEIAPALRRDPDYLMRHQMEVVTHDGVVITDSPDADALRRVRAGSLEIRQRPGGANSLGLVKFLFPNDYDVYLHGTPEKRLFERPRRDLSHGCVRVQDPEGLAAWVLRHDASWTRERIRSAMNGEGSLVVRLPEHIPVVIFYSTAMVDDDGAVGFYPDVYGLDEALKRALEAARP